MARSLSLSLSFLSLSFLEEIEKALPAVLITSLDSIPIRLSKDSVGEKR